MAQSQTNMNHETVCEKIFNAVYGGRKVHLISHHAQVPVSHETASESPVQVTDNPEKAGFLENKPVFLNQPGHRMIPIAFEPSIRPSAVIQKENMQPAAKNAGQEDNAEHVSEFPVQEIVINGECHGPKGKMEAKPHGQLVKVASMKDKFRVSVEEKLKLKGRTPSTMETTAIKNNAMRKKGDEDKKTDKSANSKFSEYIDHVRTKMGIPPKRAHR